ncbi:MAG: hypothetical protein ACJAV0_001454 [Shewanella sp.]|jgi:hypothetical protein
MNRIANGYVGRKTHLEGVTGASEAIQADVRWSDGVMESLRL